MISVIILAGGLGTRLRSIVSDRPKSMVLINGIPFLEYQIKYFKNQNFSHFVICSGYKHKQILDYFHEEYDDSINIKHSVENEPLGTGGAIKNALNIVDKQFFVVNGDTMTEINLGDMVNFHDTHNADLTIALVKVQNNTRYGSILIDNDNKIIDFSEKISSDHKFINAGIYLFNKNAINWNSMPTNFSLEKDLFPILIQKNKVFGFKMEGYFIDIGIPEDYARFQKDIPFCNWLKGF